MSLSTALNNAATGLRATARAADLVAGNIANSLTPGYARRELILGSSTVGASGNGVRVLGVQRVSDPLIVSDRRLAQADAGGSDVLSAALKRIEQAIGDPTSPSSLSARAVAFGASLVEAASRPDSSARLSSTITDARRLTQGFNAVATEIQDVRTRADNAIASLVDQVNTAVEKVDKLNTEIVRLGGQLRDASGLQEERQQLIDGIAEILPVREVPRANGEIALFTEGGAVLLDGRPRQLEFQAKGFVEPTMRVEDGALSGLALDGLPINTSSGTSLLGGGALQAQFDVRDSAGVEAQEAIDALARDLVERFQDPALDPTLTAGDAGLFTDLASPFDPANEEGLALRIGVNPLVDPLQGGEVWRLRDGLGAAVPGEAGQSALIVALSDRFELRRTPATGPAASQPRSVSDQVAFILSGISITRQSQDAETAFQGTRLATLREQEAASGVDTDDEMQKLLAIEQAYGANARVIQTVDSLLEELLRIT